VKKRELRHRIKQTPFKKLIRAVEDKARETGSVVVYVSSYRNSKVCPIHFALLRDNGSWHVLCTVPAATPWIETRRRC
jgi:putative transposase